MKTTEEVQTLKQAMERLEKWESDGTLENIDTLLHFVDAAVSSMTPEIVTGMVSTLVRVVEVADVAMQTELFDEAPHLLTQLDDAYMHPPKTNTGLVPLLKSLRDPEVQAGLNRILAMVKVLGKSDTLGGRDR